MRSPSIPYIDEPNPTTGFTNARLGTWLFIASEVMLFAALFSSYIVLRAGSLDWPRGSHQLNLVWGWIETALLIASGLAIFLSLRSLLQDRHGRFRLSLSISVLLAAAFLGVEGMEWSSLCAAGHTPSSHNFFALYFVLTAIHGLHVLGGALCALYFVGPGSKMALTARKQFAGRIQCMGIYWYFVDLIWIALFTVFYLT